MSNQEDPKTFENEPKEAPQATDELDAVELDQVVGGVGPSNTFGTPPPSSPQIIAVLIGL